MNELKLSVVVPTYNRGRKILSVLDYLSNQTLKEFEVVVVNDGSTDDTAAILDEISHNSFPFKLRVIHQKNMGRAGSRNSGFSLADSSLIVSIDDDMRLEPNCLREHYYHHQQNPGSILVGVQKEDPALAQTDIQKYLAFVRIAWLKELENAINPMPKDKIYITAANFSISKDLFEKLGGFDPNLKAVVDYDLAMRASELDIPIYYSSTAFGWHDDFITCKSYVKRRRQGVENERLLMQIKPELASKYHRYKEEKPSTLKLFVYSLLAHSFFVTLIDEFNVFKYILPRGIRYKFYSAVVMALGKYYPKRPL
jgi:glycosyltransferase involved in cell wall biosynthesis